MYVPTEDTQARIRRVLHDLTCDDSCSGAALDWDRRCHRLSVQVLGMIMPVIAREMFPVVRADERARIARDHGGTDA